MERVKNALGDGIQHREDTVLSSRLPLQSSFSTSIILYIGKAVAYSRKMVTDLPVRALTSKHLAMQRQNAPYRQTRPG